MGLATECLSYVCEALDPISNNKKCIPKNFIFSKPIPEEIQDGNVL